MDLSDYSCMFIAFPTKLLKCLCYSLLHIIGGAFVLGRWLSARSAYCASTRMHPRRNPGVAAGSWNSRASGRGDRSITVTLPAASLAGKTSVRVHVSRNKAEKCFRGAPTARPLHACTPTIVFLSIFMLKTFQFKAMVTHNVSLTCVPALSLFSENF